MRLRTTALALLAPVAALAAGCERAAGSPPAPGDHSKPAAVAPTAVATPTAASRKDICDVYAKSAGQVNTAQIGFETIHGPDWKYDDPGLGWDLSVMTTVFDDYGQLLQGRLVDGLVPEKLGQPFAAWADSTSAWRSDVPDDYRAKLGPWLDATTAMRLAYRNKGDRGQIEAARKEYEDAKKDANDLCGIKEQK